MAKDKVHKVMGEFKRGTLHSGSESGPRVTNRKQAVAIAMSEARKSGEEVGPEPAKRRKTRRQQRRAKRGPPTTTVFQGDDSYKSY